jgi:hypothetical protein
MQGYVPVLQQVQQEHKHSLSNIRQHDGPGHKIWLGCRRLKLKRHYKFQAYTDAAKGGTPALPLPSAQSAEAALQTRLSLPGARAPPAPVACAPVWSYHAVFSMCCMPPPEE